MNTIPRNQQDLLAFLSQHAPVWQARSAELGLSAAEAQAVLDAYEAAQAQYNAAQAARSAAISATLSADNALRAAHEAAAAAVRIIRNTATVSGDDGIYATAHIAPPRPARPGTLAPPAQPGELRAAISTTGLITLTWSCTHPANSKGVVYTVRRKLPGEPEFQPLATVGEKRFTDRTLPAAALAGGGEVRYTVQSQRGRAMGPVSWTLVVQFGSGIGNGFSARMAA